MFLTSYIYSRINQDIDQLTLKAATACTSIVPSQWKPSANICPDKSAMIIALTLKGERQLVSMRWGLKMNENTKTILFNARCETLMEKPTFKALLEKGQRCVVPVRG